MKPTDYTESDWMSMVADLGCVVCKSPACVHHMTYRRKGERVYLKGFKKLSNYESIPLCHLHHQDSEGIHRGVKSWEAKYGYQEDHYTKVCEELGVDPIPPNK